MLAIIRMIVVLSSICGLSGFALSYLKISTAPRIEEQVLTYVQGPAILKVFADIDNSPIAERKTFTLDGAKVTVFPGKKDGKLVAVALEHFGKGGPGLHRTVYRQTRRRAAQVAGRGHRRRFRRDHFFHRRGDRARQRREGLCGAQA